MSATAPYRPEGLAKSPVDTAAARFAVQEWPVPPAVAAEVKTIWATTWRLAAGETMVAPAVPSACVTVMFERNPHYTALLQAKIVGPMRRFFPWTIAGEGFSFGLTFAPGGFYPLWRKPLRELQDAVLDFREHFGLDAARLTAQVLEAPSVDARQAAIAAAFEAQLAAAPALPEAALLREARLAFDLIVARPTCVGLADLCAYIGASERSIERLFDRFIGVSPKLAIRTVRFQQALTRVLAGEVLDWADFAGRMGYCDQAHFCRDFVALTGRNPQEVRAERAGGGNVQSRPAGPC